MRWSARLLILQKHFIRPTEHVPNGGNMVSTRRASTIATGPGAVVSDTEPPRKRAKTTKAKATGTSSESEYPTIESPLRPKRRSVKNDIDLSSFPKRHDSLWKVGAHVSSAGGVENALVNAAKIGANSLALFLKSQRKWTSPPLSAGSIEKFKARMKEYNYPSHLILPHGSYLINLGNPDAAKREKSYECFIDDLRRCEQLGLTLYNFHPGSTVGGTTVENSISLISESINRAHKVTTTVVPVIENMAGAGNVIGGDFSHLGSIIAEVEDKSRVGVCIDTCHMFAAGYDIRKKDDWDAAMKKFESEVGLKYLKGMHLNDSKTPLESKKDRHENIGSGHIGILGFHHILNDPRIQNIPLILETPSFELPQETWMKEIEVLNKLTGFDILQAPEDQLASWVREIKDGVITAEKASGKGKKAKIGGKRKKDETDHDSEEDI